MEPQRAKNRKIPVQNGPNILGEVTWKTGKVLENQRKTVENEENH